MYYVADLQFSQRSDRPQLPGINKNYRWHLRAHRGRRAIPSIGLRVSRATSLSLINLNAIGDFWPRAIEYAIIQWLQSWDRPTHDKQEDFGAGIAVNINDRQPPEVR